MGLNKKERDVLVDLISSIDFDDVYGVSDIINRSKLEKRATKADWKYVDEQLIKKYGEKRASEVLRNAFDD